ncbi:hypothetical protein JI58_01015 [Marinosulfonomonas sp. PRT-SC04]|nr:hypothetical protein JI58_01015 [Marinosulfonomonas sp. PRT-SC04]
MKWCDVPINSRDVLRLSLQDWVSVALAGVDEPVSTAVRDMVLSEGGADVAHVFGTDVNLPARAAALANGSTSHALDYDDTHFLHIGHPSVVVFSATLAVAQQVGASGQGFLEAALVAYETSCRIGAFLGRDHYEAGFHMTATAGCFGAALGAGRLLGLNPVQLRAAIGLASTRASGLKAQFGSMGKPYNAGLAAANGVEAALLAARGMTSDQDGLASFAMGHSGAFVPGAMDGFGQRFVIDDTSHKFHACCHGIHATLEALALIEVEVDEITEVVVTVHPRWLKVCNKPTPATGLEAKFSYKICVAMALSGIETGALDSYSDANCTDADLCRLRDLVRVQGDANLADGEAQVSVRCHDDMQRDARFNLDQPMDLAARQARVLAKSGSLIGSKSQTVWRQIEALESADDLDSFIAAFA